MGDYIDFRIWYGGTFEVATPGLRYVGGDKRLLRLDTDHLSFFELVDYAMECGSYESKDFHLFYYLPDNKGLKRLVSDIDVIELGNKYGFNSNEILDVYVQQGPICKP